MPDRGQALRRQEAQYKRESKQEPQPQLQGPSYADDALQQLGQAGAPIFNSASDWVTAGAIFTGVGIGTVGAIPAVPAAVGFSVAALDAIDATTIRLLGGLAAASPTAVNVIIDLGVGFQIGNQVLPGVTPQGPVQWIGFGAGAAWWYLSDE